MALTYPVDLKLHPDALVGSIAASARDATLDKMRSYTLHHTGKAISATDTPAGDTYSIFVQLRVGAGGYTITPDGSAELDKIHLQSGESAIVPAGVTTIAWKSGATEAGEAGLQIVGGPPIGE